LIVYSYFFQFIDVCFCLILGIPGFDESYLPRWIGYAFGSLILLNHFLGSDSATITTPQLVRFSFLYIDHFFFIFLSIKFLNGLNVLWLCKYNFIYFLYFQLKLLNYSFFGIKYKAMLSNSGVVGHDNIIWINQYCSVMPYIVPKLAAIAALYCCSYIL
jgi:hypothetical protein